MKSKTQKIIIGIILANVLFANFALAQSAPPAAGPATERGTIVVTKQKDTAAQASRDACKTYNDDVSYVFYGKYKAIWYATSTPVGEFGDAEITGACLIVPWEFPIIGAAGSIDADGSKQPTGAKLIQTQIREGNGISSDTVSLALAQDEADKNKAGAGSNFVGSIINVLFLPINATLGMLTAFAGGIFAQVLDYTLNVTTMPTVVNVGWVIVRDICNMFFILILIVIALAAILRIESYDYRHLLGEVIIMALLVNFSMIIAVTLMNFVNVIVGMFAFQGGWAGLKEVFAFAIGYVGNDVVTGASSGWTTALVLSITKMVFSLVTLSAFLALAGLFVIRLVGIYVLIIISPFAYLLDILPVTKHFAHEWWQAFVKYLIWAPVALFFVRLSVNLAKSPIKEMNDSAFKYIILMALMWAAVIVAEHAGMVGGQAVINAAEKVGHGIGHYGLHKTDEWLAKGAAMEGPGRYSRFRRASSYFSPVAWRKGYEQRAKQHEAEAYTLAIGKRADTLTKVLSRGKHESDFAVKARNIRIADEMKQIPMKDKDEMTQRAASFLQHHEVDKGLGYTMKLASQGDLNEVLLKLGYTADAKGLQEMFDKHVVPQMGKANAYRLGSEISKVAEEAGHWNFAGAFKRDEETKEYRQASQLEQNEYVNVQRSKGNVQNTLRVTGRLGAGFIEKMVDGKMTNVGLAEHGKNYINSIRGDQLQEFERNGNKHLKANIVINQSQAVLDINPEVWAAAAEEYTSLSQPAREVLSQTVAAPSTPATGTINQAQAQQFFASHSDDASKKKYANLYKFANTPTP